MTPPIVAPMTAVRRCLDLLEPRARAAWWLLVPLMVGGAALEAVGASLVFALAEVVSDPEAIGGLPFVGALRDRLGGERAVIAFAGGVATFYVFKNGALFLTQWVAQRRAAEAVTHVSSLLLRGYLLVPYPFHLQRSSAKLIRNVVRLVEDAYRGVLVAMVAVVSEGLVVLAVFVVLFRTAPVLTLALALVMGAFSLVLLRLTRGAFTRWGARLHHLDAELLAHAQQSLHGVKEVKVLGREHWFYERFAALRRTASRLSWFRASLEQMPRLLLETLFVVGVTGVVAAYVAMGRAEDVVPLLGLYGYAGFRVLPSVHRVVGQVNAVRFAATGIDELWMEWKDHLEPALRAVPEEAPAPLPFEGAIELHGVGYVHPGSHRPALEGVDLVLRRGEAIGIVGSTGAGKSTLVDLLLGLLEPTTGRITIDGVDLAGVRRRWQRRLGFVPQVTHLVDDTLRRNVALGLDDADIDEARVEEALQLAQLDRFVRALPEGLDTVIGERGLRLSGGERQRLAIARALYPRPDVLVFDEATSALDNVTERELVRAIERLHGERTLVVVAHRLSTVERCDRLVLLAEGRVAAVGTYAELTRTSARFQALAGASSGASPGESARLEE